MSSQQFASRLFARLYLVVATGLATGCTGIPDEAYRLPQSSLELREMQTRSFEVAEETEILGASLALLQDMEYNIDEIERPLGVLTASKTVDADSSAEKAGLIALDVANIFLSVLSGSTPGGSAMSGAADEITLDLTLVVLPSLARDGTYTARFTLQSVLIDKADRVREIGPIDDPLIYQEIFEKLSKAIFLQGELE